MLDGAVAQFHLAGGIAHHHGIVGRGNDGQFIALRGDIPLIDADQRDDDDE